MNNDKIILEIYQKLYNKTNPRGDFKKMMESGETKVRGFYSKYYLNDDKQIEIINKVLDKHKINNKILRDKFITEILLGCSPTGVKIEKSR